MYDLKTFYGPNAGYVLELYERYRQDPASVDADIRAIFDKWSPESQLASDDTAGKGPLSVRKIVAAVALAHSIRERGHLGAHLDPLGTPPLGDPALLPGTHGLRDEDLEQLPAIIVGGHAAEGARNALEAITKLRAMYSGTISYEFDHVKSPIERGWLRDAVGLQLFHQTPSPDERRKLLRRLTQVETFERFLHRTFPGQKRFSIEGADVLVPMLDAIILGAARAGTREVIIGMAHRGRLNVLAHILEKPYTAILAEFEHGKRTAAISMSDSSDMGWTGDVRYHLGAEQVLGESTSVNLKITLAPNPSHLEFVNPVIQGMTRASQEKRDLPGAPEQDVDHTLPILIHGDAAFPGEGIVAETLNLWHLRGYWVGGTIHIILNNQLGFTTEPEDSRSTPFASDLAKGFGIPIIHVNADDPEAAITAVRLAHAYRDRFHKDVLVDLVSYRRWGHNEGDDPSFTQPRMYEIIRQHPTVREIYARKLEQEGVISPADADTMVKEATRVLEEAKRQVDSGLQDVEPEEPDELNGRYLEVPPPLSAEQLSAFNNQILTWPANFSPNTKLARLLKRHLTTLGPEGGIDWGQAEALAFASILAAGIPIRLTGQDTERGTFSHRHAVLHDERTGATYIPLQHLSEARASFSIFNSPLSEAAVLGFEYGYSVHAPDSLVLWEAQFGDFANSAQVIIDQFIASGRAKWRQKSSLVLLLPHGYEGQGPEHSSARLERFLQLSAGGNWRVANCSTAAQYFHLLRQQAFHLKRNPRPLVLMTPKSLLRHPLSAAKLEDLTQGTFQPVIDDKMALAHPEAIRRLVLCTGKIAIDLLAHEGRAEAQDLAIVRVELLYPLPESELRQVLANYRNLREVVWVQEEPRNMGAWSYMWPHLLALLEAMDSNIELQVIARPEQSSPATGLVDLYQAEQQQIITAAISGQPSAFRYSPPSHGRRISAAREVGAES
jgi:2-oxoglutarate dehydrogenase E1 component